MTEFKKKEVHMQASKGKAASDGSRIALIESFLSEQHPALCHNLLTGYLEEDGKQIPERVFNTWMIDIEKNSGKAIKKDLFFTYLNSEYIRSYNPLRDFFTDRPLTTETGHIRKLADCLRSETGMKQTDFDAEYTYYFLRKWLIGCVEQLFGKRNNLMLILTGGQNTGKSSFFRNLLPPPLQSYLIEAQFGNAKEADMGMMLGEHMLFLDDEMGGKTRHEWEQIKCILDRPDWKVRRPYGRQLERMPRMASFCGAYNSIDKEALWMEVYAAYKAGESHELSPADIKRLNDATSEFEISDPITEAICQEFSIPEPGQSSEEYSMLQVSNIIRIHLPLGYKVSQQSIGSRLKKLNVQQVTRRGANNTTTRMYQLVRIPL